MRTLLISAVAAVVLSGCIAVPVGGPGYYGDAGYYYPAPSVSVGAYYGGGGGYYRHRHRHW